MNIYKALKNDHEKVKALLTKLVGLKSKDIGKRAELIAQIRDELIPHMRAEEIVFYNSLRLLDVSKSMAMHAYTEHLEAEGLFRALQAMNKLDITWKTTAQKLKTALEKHIHEEESEMFKAGKQLFTEEEAITMAETFEVMKPRIREESLVGTTLDMVTSLMPPQFLEKFKSFNLNQH